MSTNEVNRSASTSAVVPKPTVDSSPRSSRETRLAALRGRIGEHASSSLSESPVGLGDPFAEIFAQIAAAEVAPVTPPNPPPTEDIDRASSDDQVEASAESGSESEGEAETGHEQVAVELVTPKQILDVQSTEETTYNSDAPIVDSVDVKEQVDFEAAVDLETELTGDEVAVATKFEDATTAQTNSVENDTVVSAQNTVGQARVREEGDSKVVVEAAEAVAADEIEVAPIVDNKKDLAKKSDVLVESNHGQVKEGVEKVAATEHRVHRRRYSDTNDGAGNSASGNSGAEQTENSLSPSRSFTPGTSRPTQPLTIASGTNSTPPQPVAVASVSAVAATAVSATSTNTSSPLATASRVGARPGAAAQPTGTQATSSADATAPRGEKATKTNSGKSGQEAGASQLSAVQRARLVQRVSRGFQHFGSESGQIRLKLAPASLGTVKIELNVQNSQIAGNIVTQSEAASQVLREQLPQLRASLEAQGIRVERLEINAESASDNQSGLLDSGGQGQERSLGGRGQNGQPWRQRQDGIGSTPRVSSGAGMNDLAEQMGVASQVGVGTLTGGVDLHV